ncbi:ROK family transcriptional regulator [Novosphingobium sp. BL-8A]|uniref:ROK family protein n=1 Tax=Novosphingobium sp. BL-8A TaxID=3127639 RepID=UPI003757E5CA
MRLTDHEYNRLLLLKKLRAHEPVSRTDLIGLTGLTGGTITAITAQLLAQGLIIEERSPDRGTGRPRMDLRLNPRDRYVIGTTLTAEGKLLTQIVNLRGECIESHVDEMPPATRFADLAANVARALAGVLEKSGVQRGAIYRAGVGLPGVVDHHRGVVTYIASFESGAFPFAAAVESALGIPTLVDNNTNLLARAEYWFGAGGLSDDFTLLAVDLGIGAALYKSGQLVTGAHGIEAEFGHIKIVPDAGRACHCGGAGCLQTYCSISAVIEQYCLREGVEMPGILSMRGFFRELMVRYAAGDRTIESLLMEACRYLGIAVANHITMQDPETIVVLGPDLPNFPALRSAFASSLSRSVYPSLRRRTRVHFRVKDDQNYARGAVALALERVFAER